MNGARAVGLLEQVREVRRLPTPALARAIRLSAGVSQSQLAAVVGVQRVTLARWELGTRRPRGSHALAYARVLRTLQDEVAT